jgi:hypothetical protein
MDQRDIRGQSVDGSRRIAALLAVCMSAVGSRRSPVACRVGLRLICGPLHIYIVVFC